MDVVPLHRRPVIVALLGLFISTGLYYWLVRNSPDAVTRTGMTFSILLFGLVAVISLFLFIANLLFWIRDPRKTMAAFLRLSILGVWIPFNIYVLLGAGTPLMHTVLVHLDLGLLVLLLTLTLTSQFVLPVRKGSDRLSVVRRLIGFLVGERGPVTYIQNGEAREAHEERLRRAPGVFLIDHSSGAVLRTDIQFTRAVGPGVAFTHRGEWRAESLDLRRQVQSAKGIAPPMGEPAEMDEFTPLGITQDGIPVSTDMSITFMLDPGHTAEPREGRDPTQPPYEFNPSSVEKAVYGHAYSEFDDLPWTELPLRLAIDLWREKVKDKSINELVDIAKAENPPMARIKEEIQTRLTSPTVELRGPNGQRQLEPSREYDVLRSRGVRVLRVGGIHSLYLPNEVRQERMLRWRESWAGNVQESLAEVREEIKHIRRRGEAEACAILLRDLTGDLRHQIQTDSPPGMQGTLKSILSSALRLSSQRGMVADGTNLAIHLNEIIDELSSLDENCLERGRGGG